MVNSDAPTVPNGQRRERSSAHLTRRSMTWPPPLAPASHGMRRRPRQSTIANAPMPRDAEPQLAFWHRLATEITIDFGSRWACPAWLKRPPSKRLQQHNPRRFSLVFQPFSAIILSRKGTTKWGSTTPSPAVIHSASARSLPLLQPTTLCSNFPDRFPCAPACSNLVQAARAELRAPAQNKPTAHHPFAPLPPPADATKCDRMRHLHKTRFFTRPSSHPQPHRARQSAPSRPTPLTQFCKTNPPVKTTVPPNPDDSIGA
jgi:hypothetical protein